MPIACPTMPTVTRQRIAITLALLHQWQRHTLEWQQVQDIGKLSDVEMLALDPVERDDPEPALIRKVLAALRPEEDPTILKFTK